MFRNFMLALYTFLFLWCIKCLNVRAALWRGTATSKAPSLFPKSFRRFREGKKKETEEGASYQKVGSVTSGTNTLTDVFCEMQRVW